MYVISLSLGGQKHTKGCDILFDSSITTWDLNFYVRIFEKVSYSTDRVDDGTGDATYRE